MSRWWSKAVGGGLVCLVAGCAHGGNTRLPVLDPPDPDIEKQSYRFHDPYPDEDVGPETSHRPREFVRQRTEPRRAAEQRALMGVPAPYSPYSDPALPPAPEYPSGGNYPQSLRY